MKEHEIKDIKDAVTAAMEDARKKFWVDAETHFVHHQSIENWMKTFGLVKKSVVVSFVTGVGMGLIGIFWLGVKTYMKITGHE